MKAKAKTVTQTTQPTNPTHVRYGSKDTQIYLRVTRSVLAKHGKATLVLGMRYLADGFDMAAILLRNEEAKLGTIEYKMDMSITVTDRGIAGDKKPSEPKTITVNQVWINLERVT